MNLRGRIRGVGIRCIPWRIWKGELDYLPISSKTLFYRSGLPIDLWEITLKSEGFLFQKECLLEVLKIENNLFRVPFGTEQYNGEQIGEFPEDWTEEDFKYYEWEKANNDH